MCEGKFIGRFAWIDLVSCFANSDHVMYFSFVRSMHSIAPRYTGWNFSPDSERNPLEMKVTITDGEGFSPGLKILCRFLKPSYVAFLAQENGLEKSAKSPCIGNGMSARAGKATWAYATRLFIFFSPVEICHEIATIIQPAPPGWNSPFYHPLDIVLLCMLIHFLILLNVI